MENIDSFIKKLKILYVEDEEDARLVFGKFLSKKFDISEICSNGLDGYLKFEDAQNSNNPFDIIISDINMPKMDGIEFLEKVREKDKAIPFIFTTARTESEHLLKAVNLHANHYLLKPLDFDKINETLQTVCEEIYYRKQYEIQRKETEAYISVLNNEAIVTKTDYEGNITFVNSAFLETTGYTMDEVIGKNHNILRHPDNPVSLYKDMWDTIKSGKTWEGRLKNISKNKETYYINTKIIPIFDEAGKNIVEFISIRFIVTDEEKLRRAQNKRFLEQITQYKKEIAAVKKEKEDIVRESAKYNENINFLKDRIVAYDKKIKALLQQIGAYEQNNLEMSKVDLMMKQDKSKQFEVINRELMKLKTLNRTLLKEIEALRKNIEDKDKQIMELEHKKVDYEKRIRDQLDLINNLQGEVKKLKGEVTEESVPAN